MMERETARNMWSSNPKINLRNECTSLVLLYEYITMHGPLKVKMTKLIVAFRKFVKAPEN
jgi:hypothetical protein